MGNPIIVLKNGYVEGKFVETNNEFLYASFQGIRYAKPPVFDRRFNDPDAPDNWNGIYNATYQRDHCLQLDSHHNVVGNEDCLYLNVYTPRIPSLFSVVQLILPVMVWIHGGGFISGSGDDNYFGPDFIVENNVILVTLNYRLGVMGFMNLGIESAPGNAGLKDQVMALKWVQENIKAFAGDPNKVTIFGESAGGASVQYLMLSPMAQGLFHRAISHSGSCLSTWSYISEKINMFDRAVSIAKMSGNVSYNPHELLKILQGIDPRQLVQNSFKLRTFDDKMRDSAFVFAPSIEFCRSNTGNFMIEPPIKSLTSGNFIKVPFISGFNSEEGIYYIYYARSNQGHIDWLNKNFQYVVPSDMNLRMDSEDSLEVARLIKKFYFHGNNIDNSTMPAYINLYTDYAFLYKIIEYSNLIKNSTAKPVYFYRFSFDGDFNYFKLKNNLNFSGACHMDDLGYIFHEKNSRDSGLSISEMVRRRMVKMWTNFAKYGNPTPRTTMLLPTIWEPVLKDELNYLDISDKLKMQSNPEEKRMKFWKKLYKSFENRTDVYLVE